MASHSQGSPKPLSARDLEYAEELLQWSRSIEDHGMMYDEWKGVMPVPIPPPNVLQGAGEEPLIKTAKGGRLLAPLP